MKPWSRKRRWIARLIVGSVALCLFCFFTLILIGVFNLFHAHEHCMKCTGSQLKLYAGEHQGHYPLNTNGFGDAMLDLLRETDASYAHFFTAPGDDGLLLRQCLRTGAHMPEERCTRVYVQGFDETGDPRIALVFDRYPTRGGDHFRCPWGPLLREVSMLDGSMQVVREENWPEFRKAQIELLVANGISRDRAESLYASYVR